VRPISDAAVPECVAVAAVEHLGRSQHAERDG